MNKSGYFLLSIILLSLSLPACKARREARKETKIKSLDINYITSEVNREYVDFEYASARVKMRFTDTRQDLQTAATIRMKKDSIIWISISPVLGIEAFRISISPDSIIMLDKLKKTYSVMPFSQVKAYAGIERVNFWLLQDLLVGNSPFNLNPGFAVSYLEDKLVLTDDNDTETVVISIPGNLFRPGEIQFSGKIFNQNIKISFTKHQIINNKYIPQLTNLELFTPNRIHLSLEYTRFTLNELQEFPFSIPPNFEKK
jgi:hypothetical protein